MRVLIWGLAGLVLGAGLLVLVAGVIMPALWPVSQAEGAYAMGVIFFMAPAGAVLGAILGALLGWWRS
jgi:hypothetical protein